VGARNRRQDAVNFPRKPTRIYLATVVTARSTTLCWAAASSITSTGSGSTVVWNPWTEKADKMGDFGPGGHLGMVCVETANAAGDVIQLAPGATAPHGGAIPLDQDVIAVRTSADFQSVRRPTPSANAFHRIQPCRAPCRQARRRPGDGGRQRFGQQHE